VQSTNDSIDILIVAAEASSALYACRLLEYWKKAGVNVRAFGIGSREMENLGVEIVGRSEELAVVGLFEVIKHAGEIRRVYNRLVELALERKPKAVLLLDYPGFNLRLAKKLKKQGLKIIYYISPQIWAWHKSRIHDIRKSVDKMLVVLPFEVDFYRGQNVEVEFVGHPLLDEINPQLFDEDEHRRSREKFGVGAGDFCVGLMPGSRYSELSRHLKVQVETAELLYDKNPRLKFMLLVAPNFSVDEIKAMLPQTHIPLILCKGEPMQMVSLVDAVLCASGTATLVVGLMKKPMVVMYKMNPMTAWLARHFVTGTAHFGLINLILNSRVVQEFFQGDANAQTMAAELQKIIDDKTYYNEIKSKLASSHELLGRKGATERVARALNTYLDS